MPESRIEDLNPEQLRAATAGEGPVLTIAGAGTGKTKTLAARVAWLVSQGIDPGRIMLLTFTRRASDEMLHRARRALSETGSSTLGTVWGGTFHSVANRLLRTYGEAIGLDPDFTVMDQSDAEDLMDASRHNHALGSKEKRFPRKETCLSIYSRCVNSSDLAQPDYRSDVDADLRAYVTAACNALPIPQGGAATLIDAHLQYRLTTAGDETATFADLSKG